MRYPSTMLFFFNDTATTEIYTLSLHDALPIWLESAPPVPDPARAPPDAGAVADAVRCEDRKSTRLNSSHQIISYAVFCLKKKNKIHWQHRLETDDCSHESPIDVHQVISHLRTP